ncbi:MAG: imidazole glycerol phosphate synthase subunit HisH [Pseudomonadota bacterium]
MKRIGIVNTKAGNITSLMAAVKRLNREPVFLETPQMLEECDQLLIPGQGRFGSVMRALEEQKFDVALHQWREQNKPLIGICVGFQILFESSEEDSEAKGMGWLSGHVTKLHSPKQPMVGWASVNCNNIAPFPSGIGYYVNSYVISASSNAVGFTEYGQNFVAAVQSEQTIGIQFHPEKSSAYGMEVLDKCLV